MMNVIQLPRHTPPLLHDVLTINHHVKVGGVLCINWHNEYAND